MLAESWKISDDGMTYDFFIRQGVQFQNGWGELTADDCVYTFDMEKNPANMNGDGWFFAPPEEWGFIKSYEAVSKYDFRVHLSQKHMLLDELMDFYSYVYCKKYVESVGTAKAFKEPIGTGPWQWVETAPGDHIKFEANEGYWDKVPEFKYLTLKLVPDPSSRVFMVQTGQANMALISPDKIAEVQAAGLKVVQIPERRPCIVQFGGQHLAGAKIYDPTCPWDDHSDEPANSDWNQRALKVREALCLAIDYQAMIDNIMHGYATPYVLHDITMDNPLYDPAWQPYPYDPTKAKALLAEAGYPNGFDKPVQVLIPSTPVTSADTRAIAEAVASELEALGLKVQRRVMDPNLIDEEWTYGFNTPWKIRVGLGWCMVHPATAWVWSRSSSSPIEDVGQRVKWDEYIAKTQAAKTDEELNAITKEAYAWAYTIYEARGLFVAPYLFAVGPEIKGWSKLPLWAESQTDYDFWFQDLQRAEQ
jgi:peptide/nickel transport system substrate-binding protein